MSTRILPMEVVRTPTADPLAVDAEPEPPAAEDGAEEDGAGAAVGEAEVDGAPTAAFVELLLLQAPAVRATAASSSAAAETGCFMVVVLSGGPRRVRAVSPAYACPPGRFTGCGRRAGLASPRSGVAQISPKSRDAIAPGQHHDRDGAVRRRERRRAMGELFILLVMGFVALAVVGVVVGVVAGLASGGGGRSGHGRPGMWADGGRALGNDDPTGLGYSGGHGHHGHHGGHHGHHGQEHGGPSWGGFDGGGHHGGHHGHHGQEHGGSSWGGFDGGGHHGGFDAGGGGHHG
ncbi:hypothetical protein ACFQZC_03285 [Streptacidiphilus monticola]